MAKLFYQDKPVIGLDISSTGVKIMAINAKRWLVSGYGSIDLDPAEMKSALEGGGQYLSDSIRSLVRDSIIGSLPSNHAVIGIPTNRSYSRTFTLPASSESALKDAVEIEVDQYIPVPMSNLYVDYEIIERNKGTITVLMSAVLRSIVDNCIAAAETAGLRPIMVEPSISAVARVLRNTEDGHLPSVVIDIGLANTDVAILDGSIRVSSGLAIGGNTFTLNIAKKMNISLENAHQLKVLNGLSAGSRQAKISRALEPNLQQILSETRKVIRYYNERLLSGDRKLEQVLIVGSGSNVPGIGEYFTDHLVMAARVASPWQQLNFNKLPEPAKQFRPRYITVAGLASVIPEDIWK